MRRLILIGACATALTIPAGASAANDPLRSAQWNLSMVESDPAHATATGVGATVAIIDTGVKASHPDLAGPRLLPGYDFVDGDGVPQDEVDGHGTHVLGIVGATENNALGVASVAPGARLLPVRVLDNEGSGTVEDVIRGIDYAIAQRVDVINLSLGGDPIIGQDDGFDAAIDRALNAGIVVAAAAGNDSLPLCSQPSGAGRLLCVGSVDRRGTLSFFSNYGSGLGLVGPGGSGLPIYGEDVVSTYNDNDDFYGGPYYEVAGTSQATPHVAGVAALLVSKGIRGQAAANRILATARDAGTAGPDPAYGAGIVNARAAVAGLPAGTVTTPPATGLGSAARIAIRKRDRLRAVLRRGIRVRCRAAATGRCRVRASRRGKRVAAGSKRVTIGRSVLVRARLNRRGRALVRRAIEREKSLKLRVRITLPGIAPQRRFITLRP